MIPKIMMFCRFLIPKNIAKPISILSKILIRYFIAICSYKSHVIFTHSFNIDFTTWVRHTYNGIQYSNCNFQNSFILWKYACWHVTNMQQFLYSCIYVWWTHMEKSLRGNNFASYPLLIDIHRLSEKHSWSKI